MVTKLSPSTSLKGVGEQYFDVDGLKLKSGNLFSAQDVADNNQVALIDESAKKSIFPDENPIGKIVMFNKRPLRIMAWYLIKQMGGQVVHLISMRLTPP